MTLHVHAGVDQTRLGQCELWIQFGMPMWVEDENVGYAHLEGSTAEEVSRHAHAQVANEDLQVPEDDDGDTVLPGSDRRSPRKSTQARAFQAGDADEEEPEASQAPRPKKAEDQGGSRARADDPDATPGGEEDAEHSGSRNSSGLHIEE